MEYFDEEWKGRVLIMSSFIPPGTLSVIDLGCGKMWLKEFLPAGCAYIGVDYTYRGENSLVYDLNQYQYPEITADVIFLSGVLEYINDHEWLIKKIATSCKMAIISYCSTDHFPLLKQRRQLHWVNDLSERDIIDLFSKNQMILKEDTETPSRNSIFVFENE